MATRKEEEEENPFADFDFGALNSAGEEEDPFADFDFSSLNTDSSVCLIYYHAWMLIYL